MNITKKKKIKNEREIDLSFVNKYYESRPGICAEIPRRQVAHTLQFTLTQLQINNQIVNIKLMDAHCTYIFLFVHGLR